MELWSYEHKITLLPAFVAMIGIGLLLRWWLGKKDYWVRMIPVQILTVILLVLEVGKQGFSFARGYDLYHIPLHFCSLYLFALPVLSFYRGKHHSAVAAVCASITASLCLLIMIYPALIYGAWDINHYFDDYFAFHTVTFHNIVLLIFVLMVALDLYVPEKKGEWKPCAWFTVGFCLVSATMAQLLKTNYANYYQCNIPPLEAVRQSLQPVLGYGVTQLIYVLIVSALNIGFVLMCYWLYRAVRKVTHLPKNEK